MDSFRSLNKQRPLSLHFVGIGGIGMSGIALVFRNQGHEVSGSDLAESEMVRTLRAAGIRIEIGHRAENIHQPDVVVISSAVKATNPEVVAARLHRIPVIPRAESLAELMRGKTGVAVAGSHGKTTTTSILSTLFNFAELDPTLIIGGQVDLLGGNAKLGKSDWVIAEADESDGSFLHLPATYAVVTNIDNDHLDHYGSLDALDLGFVDFIGRLPFYGRAFLCADDPGIQRILGKLTKPYSTFGFSKDADHRVEITERANTHTRFRMDDFDFQISVPGDHNVLNAAGAICVAQAVGMRPLTIQQGLLSYRGVRRRFELKFRDEASRVAIIDDYGHHPTEIRATLEAARRFWSEGKIITIFQPHRYSRTQNCFRDFSSAFSKSDELWLTEIYAAGEDPISGISGQSLAVAIEGDAQSPTRVQFVESLEGAREELRGRLPLESTLILCMGAGSITKLPNQLIEELTK